MKTGQAMQKTGGRNPQLTKQRILEAALEEFSAKGFAGARVDVIARRARINKRMLYHYFGDKEGLFREVLRRKIAERSAWLAGAPEEPAERLPFWFQLACRDREWIQLLQWEALQWGEKKVIDEERRTDSVAKAVERVRQQQAKGLIDPTFDAGQLLLSMMAITSFPIAFPQITRLMTGLSVSDEKFQKQREIFLRQFGALLQGKKTGSNSL
jgi:AcrR family transcriptional regulator